MQPAKKSNVSVTPRPPVPPHTPSCDIPSGAVTGSAVQLRCRDRQSIPPATYSWFKDNQQISPPRNANATYLINSHTGILVSRRAKEKEGSVCSRALQAERCNAFLPLQEFKAVAKEDTGQYSCLASNGVGPPKMCEGKHMTIGVCLTPPNTFQPWRKSGMQWRGKSSLKYEWALRLFPSSRGRQRVGGGGGGGGGLPGDGGLRLRGLPPPPQRFFQP